MADRIEKDIQRFVRGVDQLISRRLPIYAGKTAQQHFRENFTKGDFVDGEATYFYWHQRSWPQNKKKDDNPKRLPSGELAGARRA
jgi:hypothetical protein